MLAAFRETDLGNANAKRKITFKFLDGRTVDLDLDKHLKDNDKGEYNEYTDEMLPPEGAKGAIYDK